MIKLSRRQYLTGITSVSATARWTSGAVAAELHGVPAARVVGKGRYAYLGIALFDATLFAPDGRYDPFQPFALRLEYLRSLKGAQIADRSIDEIRKQGFQDVARLKVWRRELLKLFPSVSSGTSITGTRSVNGVAHFFLGSDQFGSIVDREFTRHFFNIWLGPNSSSQSLRKKLLGLS